LAARGGEVREDELVEGEILHHRARASGRSGPLHFHDDFLGWSSSAWMMAVSLPSLTNVAVGQAARAEDLAALVDEGLDEGIAVPLSWSDVVDHAAVLDVGLNR